MTTSLWTVAKWGITHPGLIRHTGKYCNMLCSIATCSSIVIYCPLLHHSVHYCTILSTIAPFCPLLHHSVHYCTILCAIAPFCPLSMPFFDTVCFTGGRHTVHKHSFVHMLHASWRILLICHCLSSKPFVNFPVLI